MRIVNLVQGTPEWHAHRADHLNASEAPIMLGEFPNISRSELLKVRATGVAQEISWFLQQIFDNGHQFEALARPLAEDIVGEDLYPCVGTHGRLSASFDGLTLLEDTAFEHKTLNAILRACMTPDCVGTDLPLYHQIQMEQQCMVSQAGRVLFMASEWKQDPQTDEWQLVEERHCWYYPNPELRERIVPGWEQFEADVCAYQVVPVAEPVVGKAPDQLPALRIELQGMVTASNLGDFRAHAMGVLSGINRNLQTDSDFADAEQTVKWATAVEKKLDAAKAHALSQTADIDAMFRTMDDVKAETRRIRLELEKLVGKRKDERRIEIVQAGRTNVQEHYDQINSSMGQHAIAFPAQAVTAELGASIKGKKSFTSMEDAVSTAAANIKITASQLAERIRANVHIFEMEVGTFGALFPDRVQLCSSKSAQDLLNLITVRISEQQRRDAARLEAERAKIREEEAARAKKVLDDAAEATRQQEAAAARAAAPAPVAEPVAAAPELSPIRQVAAVAAAPAPAPVTNDAAPWAPEGKKIKLGEISALIGPLCISADGLRQLGFEPVSTERGAKLYAADQVPAMCEQMIRVLRAAANGETYPLAA
ncbi:hypothetical protein ABRP17_016410 [Stenotrophomonas sp. WHRI 8082]|uniref:hypothetical protein n=1 Tax=Stenotrophomonas sp. WHRI 8082 TaxID=3162571 RepID=UPI0032EF9F04